MAPHLLRLSFCNVEQLIRREASGVTKLFISLCILLGMSLNAQAKTDFEHTGDHLAQHGLDHYPQKFLQNPQWLSFDFNNDGLDDGYIGFYKQIPHDKSKAPGKAFFLYNDIGLGYTLDVYPAEPQAEDDSEAAYDLLGLDYNVGQNGERYMRRFAPGESTALEDYFTRDVYEPIAPTEIHLANVRAFGQRIKNEFLAGERHPYTPPPVDPNAPKRKKRSASFLEKIIEFELFLSFLFH